MLFLRERERMDQRSLGHSVNIESEHLCAWRTRFVNSRLVYVAPYGIGKVGNQDHSNMNLKNSLYGRSIKYIYSTQVLPYAFFKRVQLQRLRNRDGYG